MTFRRLYSIGQRKAVMVLGAVVLLTGYALYSRAPFDQYGDRLTAMLLIALGAHVAQQATSKALPASPPP